MDSIARIARNHGRNGPRALAALAPLLLAAAPSASDVVTGPGNVLILVADDLGADQLALYGAGPEAPSTPNLEALAAGGVVFRNAWSSPAGSPTRAMLMTGRYGFRTGIGGNVTENNVALDPVGELLLPSMLDLGTGLGWDHAAFGKWHLGNASVGGPAAPSLAGWAHFVGTERNLEDYFEWPKVEDSTVSMETAYATSDTVNEFLAWRQTAAEPWVAYVAFHAPRAPYHAPPAALHSVDLSTAPPPGTDPRPYYEAMVESLDTEIGRLVNFLGPDVLDTTIVFLADNGAPAEVQVGGSPGKAKNTVYESGIRVPLIVSGPLVAAPGSTSDALVSAVDVFATVADLAGVDAQGLLAPGEVLDGLSLAPYLEDPAAPSAREVLFTEVFTPNGAETPDFFLRAVSDGRHKLHLDEESQHRLFDLEVDPTEDVDLLPEVLAQEAQEALELLAGELYPLVGLDAPEVLTQTCAGHVAGSLGLASGLPLLGTTVRLGLDNPAGTQPAGLQPLLVLALDRLPCGVALPGLGMAQPGLAAGDLVIDPAQIVAAVPAEVWSGPGEPALAALEIPVAPALVGASLFAQGLFTDPLGPDALTEGLELRFGL